MWNDYIFEILEIERTYDTKKIKKAYANMVKKYHPEEYPEKWKEIQAAYKTALALARKEEYLDGRVKTPEFVIKEYPERWKEIQTAMKAEELEELDSLFDNIGTLSKEQQAQDKEAYEKELQEVLRSFGKISDKKKLDRKEWEDFFSKKTRLPYICNREFLKRLGECFSDRKIDAGMYQFLLEQLEVIKTYCTDRNIVL